MLDAGMGDTPLAFDDTHAHDGPAPAAAPRAAGVVIAGRYEVIRLIATGGMGEVYEAQDRELGERVALKRIRGAAASDPGAIERFKREIQLARKVTHANVCRIHDLGVHRDGDGDGEPEVFLSMELLAGETLAARIKRGKLTTGEARPLLAQLAAGLGAAHAAGIIHRDLKSQNVILVDGRAVITDFGLARLGADQPGAAETTGAIVGTPAYMAPEQVSGGAITVATDVYALGVVAYEMVTGKLPFVGETALQTAAMRLEQDAPAPGIDATWDAAILRCLARAPADRFASAADFVTSLSGAPRRRRFGLALAGATVAATCAVVGVLALRGRDPARSAEVSGPRTIAVLGFRNTTGGDDAAWISTALVEMLATELSIGGLHAVPAETVSRARADLALPDADSFAADTLARIRRRTGAELVVVGSYVGTGAKLRVDLRLQDTRTGATIATLTETTTSAALLDAVPRIAGRVRDELGVAAPTIEESAAAGATRPHDPEAARLYAQGLDRMHAYDLPGARALLEDATRREPAFAMAHRALSEVLGALDYDGAMKEQARDEAHTAFVLSGSLPDEERLAIEARYHQVDGEHDQAIAASRALAASYPSAEHAIALVDALLQGDRGDDASAELAKLREPGSVAAEDPRLELLELRPALARDLQSQRVAIERGIVRARAREERRLLAELLIQRTWNSVLANREFAVGRATADEAAKICRELGDDRCVAEALHASVATFAKFSDLEGAVRTWDETVAIWASLGDQGGALDGMGDAVAMLSWLGETDQALARADRMVELARSTGTRADLAYNRRAWALDGRGEVTQAATAIALALAAEAEVTTVAGHSRLVSAIVMLDQGKLADARGALEAMFADPAADVPTVFLGGIELLSLAMLDGRGEDALAIARVMEPWSPKEAEDFHVLGQLSVVRALVAAGQLDEAKRTFDAVAPALPPLATSVLGSAAAATARLDLAVATDPGSAPDAASALAAAIELARRAGAIRIADDAELDLARWELDAGRAASAKKRLKRLEQEARPRGAIRVADRAKAMRQRHTK